MSEGSMKEENVTEGEKSKVKIGEEEAAFVNKGWLPFVHWRKCRTRRQCLLFLCPLCFFGFGLASYIPGPELLLFLEPSILLCKVCLNYMRYFNLQAPLPLRLFAN